MKQVSNIALFSFLFIGASTYGMHEMSKKRSADELIPEQSIKRRTISIDCTRDAEPVCRRRKRVIEKPPAHWKPFNGSLADLKALPDPHASTDKCWSLLHAVVLAGNAECVEFLLAPPTLGRWDYLSVNAEDENSWTPLHVAAWQNSVECLLTLLDHGATIDAQTKVGCTALQIAAMRGSLACLQILLAHEADSTIFDKKGNGPIHSSILYDTFDCFEELLKNGPPLAPATIYGLLHLAIKNHEAFYLKMLLDHGVDSSLPDTRGKRPVHIAARYDAVECLEVLAQAGAQLEVTDSAGTLPLHIAARYGSTACLKMLLMSTNTVDVQINSGATPYVAVKHESLEGLESLIHAGADLNIPLNTGNGNTPMIEAIANRSISCLTILVSHGAYLEASNAAGLTPFQVAAQMGFVEGMKILIDAGASVLWYPGMALKTKIGRELESYFKALLEQSESCIVKVSEREFPVPLLFFDAFTIFGDRREDVPQDELDLLLPKNIEAGWEYVEGCLMDVLSLYAMEHCFTAGEMNGYYQKRVNEVTIDCRKKLILKQITLFIDTSLFVGCTFLEHVAKGIVDKIVLEDIEKRIRLLPKPARAAYKKELGRKLLQ